MLWHQVNAQVGGGFVIELSNEHGVAKDPCGTMELQPAGAATVTLELLKPAENATEWVCVNLDTHAAVPGTPLSRHPGFSQVSGKTVAAGTVAAGSKLTVVVPPGNTSFIEFGAAATVSPEPALKTDV